MIMELRKNASDSEQVSTASTSLSGRTLILDAAARVFREKGYAATSLRSIADACGMKAGSLYYHFESKDAIISEVLRIGVAHVLEEVRRAVEGMPPNAPVDQVVEAAVRAHLRALFESENYSSANIRIFGQVPDHVKEKHLPLRKTYEQFWTDLLNRYKNSGDIHPRAHIPLTCIFLLGTMNSTLEWFQPDKGSLDHIAFELTSIVMHGLANPQGA